MNKHFCSQSGFIGLYLSIVIVVVMLGIITSIAFGVLTQQRIMQNSIQSAQAYVAAESGIEDALLRLRNNMALPGTYPYTLPVGSSVAQVTISPVFAGSRSILSVGDSLDRFRTVEVVDEISVQGTGFFYGAHIGEGGLQMAQNSGVFGNVFSNGDVAMANNAGIGSINSGVAGSVVIAGSGNRLYHTSGGVVPFVNGDATVDICNDVDIKGILKANTSTAGCGAIDETLGVPPSPIPLPISSIDIQEWKDAAAAGGITNGDVVVSSPTALGRQKIAGNLTFANNIPGEVIIRGTLWVTGNITIGNQVHVRLDSGYGSTSGVIVADGLIDLGNNNILGGSGSAGSYLMFLSTASLNPSIDLGTNNQVDVLYASNGWIRIKNSSRPREVTGYGVELANGAVITYEIGLETTQFANGTGGGWAVVSWKEVE